MRLNNRGNWTLIGLLVAVVIVVVLGAMYLGRTSMTTVGKDNKLLDESSDKKTVIGKSLDTAKGEDCRQRLIQIRAGIATYQASTGSESFPPTLKDMGMGVSTDYFYCPVNNQPYLYDPSTGKVSCQYKGHEGF